MRYSRRAKHKGMTLIELLVAIGILAIIAVLGWRGLDSIVRARAALSAGLEQTRGMQLAFAQMQSDCAHLAGAAVLPGREPIAIEQDRFTLVRTVYAEHQPSRLQVVVYRVRDGVLTRHASAATRDLTELEALWRAAGDADDGQAVALQSDVEALTPRLWINAGWRAAAAPPVAPPAMQFGSIAPGGLEVALQLRGRAGRLLKIFLLGAA